MKLVCDANGKIVDSASPVYSSLKNKKCSGSEHFLFWRMVLIMYNKFGCDLWYKESID